MSKATKFFDTIIQSIKLSIHTNVPARVVAFYPYTSEADIEILFMTADKDGDVDKYPLIEKAPVLDHLTNLVPGDVVYVSIAERAMDELQAVPFDPDALRMFDLRDSVVIGRFKLS